MQLRLRIPGPRRPAVSNSPSGLGFLYSVILHSALFALLLSPVAETPEAKNVYTSLVAPFEKEHKLIWYKFKEQLPAVSPTNPTSDRDPNQKTPQKARQQIVTAPQADPGKQLVWIPAPQIKLKVDLSAPNVIAMQPAVPSPERPQAKPFVNPEPPKPKQPVAPNALPAAPDLATKQQQNAALEALLNKPAARPRRDFTAPALPTAPVPSPAAALPAAPALESAHGPAGVDSVLNTPMAPPRRDFTPPPAPSTSQAGNGTAPALPTAPAIEQGHGPAGVSVAILGLNPTNAPQIPTPEGSRSARIAAGPDTGPGDPQLARGNAPLGIPDVSIQGRRGPSSPSATGSKPPADKPGLGTAAMPASQSTTAFQTTPHLSIPQWPSSRTLPPFIERRFHTRVVFTTVLPAVQDGEDWVVWFAEDAPMPAPDTRLLMRPPTLMRGNPLPSVPVRQEHGTGKLLVAGILRKDGHFGCEGSDVAAQDLLDTLQSWQFNPAMRNGVPVDVEAVLEIPLVYTAAASLTAPK
ncbi:MAG TPA: hypothetical protein VLY24_11935 [Bryobacteraceae bacterium]|nr:hypothetical protein [Bryobacteraceae bacterium]